MIKTQAICDFCEKPMREVGACTYQLGQTKEFNTRKLFPHLCKPCADKLDIAFRHMRAETKKQAELAEKYARINKERLEKMENKSLQEYTFEKGLASPVPYFKEESVL